MAESKPVAGMKASGRTVRLFLVDGSPTGVLTAEIINWTGHLLAAPRSRMGEIIGREEASRTGVYFLVGDDPEEPGKSRVYIGEGDEISSRLKSHANDSSKEFWVRFGLVTSKDGNITKAHARYLESRIVELAKSAGRANVANSNYPALKRLPESDLADMEYFLSGIELLLPTVGFDFLLPAAKVVSTQLDFDPSAVGLERPLTLFLDNPKKGYRASALEFAGEITVLADSTATTETFASNSYSSLREKLISDGSLVPTDDQKLFRFKRDVAFASPSAAAAVVNNRNTNGRTEWKLDSGQTLKQWQDSQVLGSSGTS